MSIATSSMLVELNISVWGATKKDNAVTDKVTHDNNAARDAGRWQKNLMVGNDKLKELSDYAASVRTWHNHHTLPWSDKGPRLLATSLFLDYKTELNARRAWFERKRDEFIADYPTFILGVSQGLGSTHNPDDYPSVSELAQKFGFRVVFTPVPESGDFRVDVPQEELAVLRSEYDEAFDTRLAEAMKTPWEQLHKLLTGMSEKPLASGHDDGRGSRASGTAYPGSTARRRCHVVDPRPKPRNRRDVRTRPRHGPVDGERGQDPPPCRSGVQDRGGPPAGG